MPGTCVVHLARAANGAGPLERFVESYRRHPPGTAHDLVVVFKGFGGAVPPAHGRALEGLAYRPLQLPDEGFDVRAYFLAAREFDYECYCFLNSFSVIGGGDWLAKLGGHARRAGVGLVGASGSWESHRTNQQALHRAAPPAPFFKALRKRWELSWWERHFDPFPSYHLRTNAFMLRRDVLLRLKGWDARTKWDAYKFESGKAGLTGQVLAMGLEALVVGRDGRAYEKERWYESCTFRSGDQSNLLVADNRTQEYAAADEAARRLLSRDTWGEHDAPPRGCAGGPSASV